MVLKENANYYIVLLRATPALSHFPHFMRI
jgi:hypothetical protein